MNKLNVKVESMDACDGLTFFTFVKGRDHLHSIVLDGKQKSMGINKGDHVTLCFKESEVFLMRECTDNISVCNKLESTIKNIEQGYLFSKIKLDYQGEEIVALVVSSGLKGMDLNAGDTVCCMIKANEIAIIREGDND